MFGIMIVAFLFVLGLGGVAIYFIFHRMKRLLRQVETIEGMPRTEVGQLQPGLRKSTGTTVALDKPVVSPLTQMECVFYHFKVEELKSSSYKDKRTKSGTTQSYWETVVSDKQAVACGLQDATGMAHVDLLGAEMVLKTGRPKESNFLSSCPPELKETLQRRYDFSTKGLLLSKSLRFTEMVIRPGDPLFIIGDVETKLGEPPTFVKRGHDFIVSDKEEAELVKHFRHHVLGSKVMIGFVAVVALLFSAIPLYILMATANLPRHDAAPNRPQPAQDKRPPSRQVAIAPPIEPRVASPVEPKVAPPTESKVTPPAEPKVAPPSEPKVTPPPVDKPTPPAEPKVVPPIDTKVLINNVANGRMCEADKEKNNRDGSVVVLRAKTGLLGPNRQWIIKRDPNSEFFTIVNVESNRLLDGERSSSNRDGTKVHLYGTQVQGNKERLWQFKSAGGDAYYIINVANGRYLDADPASLDQQTTRVRLWGKAGEDKPQRKWTISKLFP